MSLYSWARMEPHLQTYDIRPGEFAVYSDASVRGDWRLQLTPGKKPVQARKREGPAMGGWIGWLGCEYTDRPTIAGQAFLGSQGTQTAEYLAAIHALNAVLTHLRLCNVKPQAVVLRVDNETVAKTLVEEWRTEVLTRHKRHALKIVEEIRSAGIDLRVEKVSETNKHHKAAHRLSHSAWDQLFFKKAWRPAEHPPADWSESKAASSSSRSDDELIIFQLP